MKRIVSISLLVCVLFGGWVHGAEIIHLSFGEAPLEQVLWVLEDISGLQIHLDASIAGNQPITMSVQGIRVLDALDYIVSSRGYDYVQEGKSVRVRSSLPQIELVGIVETGDDVIFLVRINEETFRVRLGEERRGWTLTDRVSPQSVLLVNNTRRVVAALGSRHASYLEADRPSVEIVRSARTPEMRVVELTSPVGAGEQFTMAVQGTPNRRHYIAVQDQDSLVTAPGLGPRVSDSAGVVEWVWEVDWDARPGEWPIIVSDGQSTLETSVRVVRK